VKNKRKANPIVTLVPFNNGGKNDWFKQPVIATPKQKYRGTFFSISEQKLTVDASRNQLCCIFLILQIFLTVSQGTKTVKVSRVSPSWAFRETEAAQTLLYIICLASILYFCTKSV